MEAEPKRKEVVLIMTAKEKQRLKELKEKQLKEKQIVRK